MINKRIIKYLGEKLSVSNMRQTDKIQYALSIIVLESEKILILLLLAYVFGEIKKFLFAFISLSIIRSVLGGSHCKSSNGCLIYSCIVYYVILSGAINIAIPYKVHILLFFILLAIVTWKAPICSKYRNLQTSRRKNNMKLIAIIFLVSEEIISRQINNEYFKIIEWVEIVLLLDVNIQFLKLYIDQVKIRRKGVSHKARDKMENRRNQAKIS